MLNQVQHDDLFYFLLRGLVNFTEKSINPQNPKTKKCCHAELDSASPIA